MAGQGIQRAGGVGHHNQDGGPAANGLRVGHININGAISKLDTIRYCLEYHGFDVFFVSEAKASTRDEDYFEIKGYIHWLVNRGKDGHAPSGGGMLLYVRKDLLVSMEPFATVHHYNTCLGVECLWIRMTYGGSHLDIAGIYIPPHRGARGKWQFTNSQRKAALLKCLRPFENQNNVIVFYYNFDLLQRIPPQYPAAEIQGMVFHQLINRATRIESGMLLDLIYVRNVARNGEQQAQLVVESGNIRCGVSDHDLIYCTVGYQNREQTFPAVEDAAQFVQQHTPTNVIQQVITAINERTQGNNNILKGSLFLPYAELLAADMHSLRTARENAFDDELNVTRKRDLEVWREIKAGFLGYLKTVRYTRMKNDWVASEITGIEYLGGFNFWKAKMYLHQSIIKDAHLQPLLTKTKQKNNQRRHVVALTDNHQNFIEDFVGLTLGPYCMNFMTRHGLQYESTLTGYRTTDPQVKSLPLYD